jgi:hypothetical protein
VLLRPVRRELYQVEVVKFHAVWIGLCGVHRYLLASHMGGLLLNAVLDDLGVPELRQVLGGACMAKLDLQTQSPIRLLNLCIIIVLHFWCWKWCMLLQTAQQSGNIHNQVKRKRRAYFWLIHL